MSLPRYEMYKNGGAGWLAEIPAQWNVVPNKAFLRDRSDLTGSNANDYTLLSLTLSGIIPRDLDSGKGKFPTDFDTYKVVHPGNLIFCLFDMDETPRTVGLSGLNGMITGAYEVYEVSPEASPRFIYYFYLHVDEFKGLRPWYTGLRKVVRPDTFRAIKIALPPPCGAGCNHKLPRPRDRED